MNILPIIGIVITVSIMIITTHNSSYKEGYASGYQNRIDYERGK